jgi:glutathione synthase
MSEKRLNLAVVMDPIEDIKPAKDTTLAMMLAAQRRGWNLSYLELKHLWLRDGVALGRAHPVAVRDDHDDWFTRGEPSVRPLGEFDAILMRKDPPFDTEYIYATYILERAEAAGAWW